VVVWWGSSSDPELCCWEVGAEPSAEPEEVCVCLHQTGKRHV
jgi:hypothetical protein